jgi:hypothetical protein
MQPPTLTAFPSQYESLTDRTSHQNSAPGFIHIQNIGPIMVSLMVSSIMWLLIIGAVYAVYSIFAVKT